MINIKKGTAHSLLQSDKVGNAKANEAVVAGMLVRIDSNGDIIKGVASQGVADTLGFAINNQTDGDVIESGKIGYIMLDGNSVIETDQTDTTINASNYPIGTRLAGDTTTGKVKAWASGDRVVGYVEGIRTLPVEAQLSQNYKNVAGTTLTNTSYQPSTKALLGIKLAV